MSRVVQRHEVRNLVPPALSPEETLTLKQFNMVPMNLSGLATEDVESLKQWELEGAQFVVSSLHEGLVKLLVQGVTDERETAYTHKVKYSLIKGHNYI